MHICIVSPDYPTSRTIDFVFVDQLCRALALKGVQITVIAPQTLTKCLFRHVPIAKKRERIYVSDDKFFTLLRPKYFSVGNVGGLLKHHNGKAYRRAVRQAFNSIKDNIDVCYGHFWQSVKAIYPLAKERNIPLIASTGEETVNQKRIGYTDEDIKNIGNYVSGIINVSTNNKNECLAAGLGNEEKCRVIPNAIDNSLFYPHNKENCRRQLGLNENDFIVIFVGQFKSRKGTMRVDEALHRIGDSSVKAIFIGSGPDQPVYPHIAFQGPVSHDQLPAYLSASDVFVLPTLQEGCCNAIIEALACGVPVVSSDLPFNYDVLDKSSALLVDPNSIEEIANAIRTLKANRQLRKRLAEGAIVKAKSLTLDHRADLIIEFIKKQTTK